MAGIGFELRKLSKGESLLSLLQAYGYAGVLSAGPWVISILAILGVGFIQAFTHGKAGDVIHFQVIVTYAFALAATLIFSGFLQLPFTRYIADILYEGREDEVLSAYFGLTLVFWIFGVLLFCLLVYFLLPDQSSMVRFLTLSIFILLSSVWISNTLVSSLKYFKETIYAYLAAYGLIVLGAYYIGGSLESLLLIFLYGNALLLTVMMILIVKRYRPSRFLSFAFFNRKRFYFSLGFAGLFYNLGTWVDKFIFWFHPLTGEKVIGNIHASVIYDLPVFLAYLSIVPGMAIFFYRLETDFADAYASYFANVTQKGTFAVISSYQKEMIVILRQAIREILIFQSIVDIALFLLAPKLFGALHIPQLYLGLFYILTFGAMLQLGFMSMLAVLFYLDRRYEAMRLSFLFLMLNAVLTLVTIYLGPSFYGYGYTISLLICFMLSLRMLNTVMKDLTYETYMLR